MEQNAHTEEPESVLAEGLHPRNRPTNETLYKETRIEDPDDPAQPGEKIVNDPNINVAIYE
jgi:hypothetical protein